MVKRATPVASFILAFLVFLTLSSPVIQSQSAVEEVFHEVDSLRLVDEPIGLGLEAFAKRLEAARISGREPLGLVLAGGSARAYAHIGVLEVLEAHGIYPDFIVANSMGAVIGMLYAAGLSPAAIGELVREVPSEAYLRLVFPSRGGLINGDAFVGAIERIIGPLDISQTKIPIIVTAEDLKTRRQVEMAQGDFSRIMATTFAMPAIFEPVPLGDFLLIDGGVTNIVPLEIAARYSKNLIVSTALYDKAMTFDNPLSVINRAIDIGKTRAGMRNLLQAKPMVIRNEVEDISYMEFATPGRIIEIGKKSAEAAIASILTRLGPEIRRDGPGPEVLEARIRYTGSIGSDIALLKGGAFPDMVPSLRYRLDIKVANDFERESMALEGQSYAGLSMAGATGRLRAALGFRAGLGDEEGRAWGMFASFAANPFHTFTASGEVRLWGDFGPWSAAVDIDSLEILASGGWRTGGPLLSLALETHGVWEFCFDTQTVSWELRPQAEVKTNFSFSRGTLPDRFPAFAQAKGGAFLFGTGASLSYGPEWTLKAGIARRGITAARGRWMGRIDLSGVGAELENEDGFRGLPPERSGIYVGVANFDVAWLANILDFSLGEIVLVKNIEAGPYYDLAWSSSFQGDTSETAFYAGLFLNLTASFAGLAPLDVAFFAGMGTGYNPIVGLRASRLFPAFR